MSARAIRALRGSDDALRGADDYDDESSSVEQDPPRKSSAFAAMMDSDDEDESSSSSSSSIDGPGEPMKASAEDAAPTPRGTDDREGDGGEEDVVEEDLDELIDEFQAQDVQHTQSTADDEGEVESVFGVVLSGLNVRDLDIDYSLRTALLGDSGDVDPLPQGRPSRRGVNARQTQLFGPPREGWVRPPHYVGGGVGMSTYDKDPRTIPWPYTTMDPPANPKHWYFFQHSDSYTRDCGDFKIVQQSGDLNALVTFVVHHPYVTEALLQLSTVLYQSNHSQEGLSLLRRCLWIYECSALLSFTRNLEENAFMDVNLSKNATFFKALFKLMQVSHIAGLPRTALAVSRFLLSLDPLRDPMGVLLALDHFALASNLNALDKWLVEMVDSDQVRIIHRDSGRVGTSHAECGLLQLPNWAYSYALALFRLSQSGDDFSDELRKRADVALEAALSSFPVVAGMLLQNLDVDTTGRSFRRDWVTVLDSSTDRWRQLNREWATSVDAIELAATLQVCDVLMKIFVHQNARLWGDESVLQWLYESLERLSKSTTSDSLPPTPSPAVVRYAGCKLSDYENRIELLPQDANIINPGMLAHAMVVNPNRPRFLRNLQRGGDDMMMMGQQMGGNGMPRQMFGGPPTEVVDPDWPVAEVFLRSFLPWTHVQGVPPPRR